MSNLDSWPTELAVASDDGGCETSLEAQAWFSFLAVSTADGAPAKSERWLCETGTSAAAPTTAATYGHDLFTVPRGRAQDDESLKMLWFEDGLFKTSNGSDVVFSAVP